jgi:hypothetical protein
MARVGRCWFCSGSDLELTDEHVLSERSFGSRSVSKSAVCAPCNRKAGELEMRIASRPLLAELVGKHSAAYGPALHPHADGYLADGQPVRVRFAEQGAEVHSLLGRDGDPANPPERLAGMRWGIGAGNFDEWPRFGAKVALGLASLVLEPTWLDTRGAAAVQAIFSGQQWETGVLAFGPDWTAQEIGEDEPFARLARGEHVVGLCDSPDGPYAWMILFGAVAYRVSLPDAAIPSNEPTWLLQPRTTPTGSELLATMRKRYAARL